MYAPRLLCEILSGKEPALFVNPDLGECIEAWRLSPLGDRDEATIRSAERFENGWHKGGIPEPETARGPFSGFRIYWRDAEPPASPTGPP